MTIIHYRGHTIRLIQDSRKGQIIYWMYIDARQLSFVSSLEAGKRIAVKYLDTILDPEHTVLKTKKLTSGHRFINGKDTIN